MPINPKEIVYQITVGEDIPEMAAVMVRNLIDANYPLQKVSMEGNGIRITAEKTIVGNPYLPEMKK